ncbi:META domain-containing protein [Shewanella sp.]|nr:META domain-containing protein [Shewanella sp.]
MIKHSFFITSLLVGLSACQSTPHAQLEDLPIKGTWYLEVVSDQPVIDYSPAQLTFEDEGKLSGNNSCNTFLGHYSLSGHTLQLRPTGNTLKACVDALTAQEQRVVKVMPEITHAALRKSKLLLKDADNKTLMVLSK